MNINLTLEQLTLAYQREQEENRPAVTAQDLPLSSMSRLPTNGLQLSCAVTTLAPRS